MSGETNDLIYEEIASDIAKEFKDHEIETMIKIYRWTKAEHNSYFFIHVLKRIYNYKKAIKKLRTKYLIFLVRGSGPYRITQDGMRVGRLMLELRWRELI